MRIDVKPGLAIGDGCPTFIIAEVGSNWRTLEDCMTSITQAKLSGADAVKFQAYDARALYGLTCKWPGFEGVHSSSLPLDWLPKLAEKAKAVGIEFMCSAFSPELIDAVDPYVSIHKVASSEMCHVRMLEKLREIGKPVILSTGAQHAEDILRAMHVLGNTPTVLMYCVAAYPAREVMLRKIDDMREEFKKLVGYSDHTTDVLEIPYSAARVYGASVTEKHVNFVGATGPDAPHSLSGGEFKRMVSQIRGVPSHALGVSTAERDMITRHKRRLIATRDIPEGTVFAEGVNFGIYRSLSDDTHAFSPLLIDEVAGRVAKRAIKVGDGIGPGDC